MSRFEDHVAEIADKPLQHLERFFTELSAGMESAGEEAERRALGAFTDDEKFAQVILMAHSRGIATAMEIAAAEVAKARAAVKEVADEWKSDWEAQS
jgi:hypothetical protein